MFRYLGYFPAILKSQKGTSQHLSAINLFAGTALENTLSYRLTPARFQQYLRYFSLFGCAVSILRGKKLSNREQLKLFLVSALAPLFDDLYDDYALPALQIERLILHPEWYHDENGIAGHVAKLMQSLNNLMDNPALLKETCLQLCHAQDKSRRMTPETSHEEILEQTLNKGGYAALLCRLVFDNSIAGAEREVIFRMGGLAQIMDDIFDVCADRNSGRITSASMFSNTEQARQYFISAEKKWVSLCRELPYPVLQKEKFAGFIHLALSAVFVCLNFYKKYYRKAGINVFDRTINMPSRLVCDMEKLSSRILLFLLASRYEKQVFQKS